MDGGTLAGRRGRRVLVIFAGALALGCAPEITYPGTEVMGTYAFSAQQPVADVAGCALLDPEAGGIVGGFDFEAVLSRDRDAGEAWYTLRETSHPGTFDGQIFRVTSSAPRRFPSCVPADAPDRAECAEVQVEETLEVALLSRSQNDALDGRCPEGAPEVGIPAPDGASLTAPDTTPTGFDAVRVCGRMVDRLIPAEGCCVPCSVTHRIQGVRR